MELLITVAYIFLVRLVFFDYKLIVFNLFWKFVVFGVWIGAVLTEIILLGQFAPYSKEAFVQTYVVQMAPEWGGVVKEVYVKTNEPVKKGDPLFMMDPTPKQYKVDQYTAELAAADTSVAELVQQVEEATANVDNITANLAIERIQYRQIQQAALEKAASEYRLETVRQQVSSLEAQLKGAKAALKAAELALNSSAGGRPTAVAEVLANLDNARYELANTIIRAPTDGYVANMQLHPGGFVRLKTPLMTFVSTEEQWVVAQALQQGIQRVAPGDKAELAFDMYPGKIFQGEVESVTWANGSAQGVPSGQLPNEQSLHQPRDFTVRLRLTEEDPQYPIRFGAAAIVAIYPKDCPGFLKLLRQIEIQSESYLNYLFNPF